MEPIMLVAAMMLSGMGVMVFIIVLTPFAERLRLLDQPDHRKRHGVAVPMVGGLSIYLVILAALLFVDPPDKLIWLIISASILVVVGALDDAFCLGVRVRFASQILASSLMIVGASVWVRSFGIEIWSLDSIAGWLGIPLTIFAVVGLTNGFNMADGIDGLASGHMLVGLGSVGLTLYLVHGDFYHLEWFIVLMSAVFAFFVVNLSLTPLKRVFLGDAGSQLLGFVMAWTLIFYSQDPIALLHPVAALWCVTIPVFDTLVVIVRRIKNRRSPFSSDRNHLHYLLVDMEMDKRLALGSILVLAIIVNAFGIWITFAISPLAGLVVYCLLFMCFGYGMLHPSIEKQLARKLRLID